MISIQNYTDNKLYLPVEYKANFPSDVCAMYPIVSSEMPIIIVSLLSMLEHR